MSGQLLSLYPFVKLYKFMQISLETSRERRPALASAEYELRPRTVVSAGLPVARGDRVLC